MDGERKGRTEGGREQEGREYNGHMQRCRQRGRIERRGLRDRETYYLLEFPVTERLLDLVELAARFVMMTWLTSANICRHPLPHLCHRCLVLPRSLCDSVCVCLSPCVCPASQPPCSLSPSLTHALELNLQRDDLCVCANVSE